MTGSREDDTPPMVLTQGDRVALESRIDKVQASFEQRWKDRADEATRFDVGRMVPVEKTASKAQSVAYFATGVAAAALVVAVAAVIIAAMMP